MEKHNKHQNLEKRIIIAERDNISAVMENGRVSDFFISRGDVILGDVFLATVDNILPSKKITEVLAPVIFFVIFFISCCLK